jgi:probable rRNA maturation factor
LENAIVFFAEDVENPIASQEEKYNQWLMDVATSENKIIENISYIFCSDDYLLDINIKHLNHDYYTDIITFPYKEGDFIESDIFISTDRVAENAQEYGETFENELKRVMVHGILHLIGYKDKSPEQSEKMRAKEDEYIARFGL